MDTTNGSTFKIKSLYHSRNAKGAKDFLNSLPAESLFSIANTACNQRIHPENKEEAVETILLYTADIDRFFAYRRITMDTLIRYLHINAKIIEKHTTHHHLVTCVKKLWAEKYFCDQDENRKKMDAIITLAARNDGFAPEEKAKNTNIRSTRRTQKSDTFAHDFAEWFYSCLNNINSDPPQGNRLHESMFCLNASLDLYEVNPSFTHDVHSVGAEDCEKGLRDFIHSRRFTFAPNLETGTQSMKSSHGLIKVLCCGTLHVNRIFFGIFEQEFGLVQSPVDKNWKIFYSKGNFKEGISILPTLTPSPVFEIDIV